MTTMNLLTLGAGGAPGGSMALDLLLILACAGLVALVFGRLRIAVIPGYLVAGALIGPHAIGLVDDANEIEGIASLATVLLMFGIGMHLDASVLRRGVPVVHHGLQHETGEVSLFPLRHVLYPLPVIRRDIDRGI